MLNQAFIIWNSSLAGYHDFSQTQGARTRYLAKNGKTEKIIMMYYLEREASPLHIIKGYTLYISVDMIIGETIMLRM